MMTAWLLCVLVLWVVCCVALRVMANDTKMHDDDQPRAVRIAGDAGGMGGPAAKGPFVKPTQVSNLALLPLHQVALVGYDDGTLKICH